MEISRPYRSRELGNSLANRPEMSPAGVGYAVQRAEAIAHDNGFQLSNEILSYLRASPFTGI